MVASHFTADAILLPPCIPRIDGQEAIADFWDAVLASGVTDLVLETTELEILGDRAIDVGTWRLSAPDGNGGTATPTGSYLVVWHQDGDGAWLLGKDIWNAGAAE